MTNAQTTRTTTAFMTQAVVSFAVATTFLGIAVAYLPVGGWPRACMGLAGLYLITSTFTLAKCVRDQQESGSVVSRLDEVRLERLLAEFDPYKVSPTLPSAGFSPPANNYPPLPVDDRVPAAPVRR